MPHRVPNSPQWRIKSCTNGVIPFISLFSAITEIKEIELSRDFYKKICPRAIFRRLASGQSSHPETPSFQNPQRNGSRQGLPKNQGCLYTDPDSGLVIAPTKEQPVNLLWGKAYGVLPRIKNISMTSFSDSPEMRQSLARMSHKIRGERTKVECWCGHRADLLVKPGRPSGSCLAFLQPCINARLDPFPVKFSATMFDAFIRCPHQCRHFGAQ